MFKKDLTPGAKSKVKSSVQRAVRTKVLDTYPMLAPYVDEIMPKKGQLDLIKLPDRVSLYVLDGQPLFWQHMDDPLVPHLKLVHAFPQCFKQLGIDRGAIRFVLSGATLMAPGLTSKGGWLPSGHQGIDKAKVVEVEGEEGAKGEQQQQKQQQQQQQQGEEVREGEVVAIRAEGKDEVCLVGQLKMGSEEMKRKGKGVVMDAGHYLGDGLWKLALD